MGGKTQLFNTLIGYGSACWSVVKGKRNKFNIATQMVMDDDLRHSNSEWLGEGERNRAYGSLMKLLCRSPASQFGYQACIKCKQNSIWDFLSVKELRIQKLFIEHFLHLDSRHSLPSHE